MKLKTSVLASALFSLTMFSAHAAQELTPEKAATLKPFERIDVSGRFNSISDAVKAVSTRADKLGAAYFYIQGSSNSNNGGNSRVTADLYHADAEKVDLDKVEYIRYNGIKELPQSEANTLMPFDTVTVSGFYPSQVDVKDAVSLAAKTKGAASFAIVRQVDANSKGGNQRVTAFIYKADAAKRIIQKENAIPADSEAGRAALAAGGAAAENVEIPGVASSSTSGIGRFFETQSSKGGRYTVTLPDGTKVQEVNKATAAQMAPFDSITISGFYNSMTDMSEAVAKQAAAKGAKFYSITRQWQANNGGNMSVSADLFK